MNRIIFSILLVLCLSLGQAVADESNKVKIKTSLGDILVVLDAEKAPKTVDNFLGYVNQGFFDGTVFHRVIKGFMIQGGGLTSDLSKKASGGPIQNEADKIGRASCRERV